MIGPNEGGHVQAQSPRCQACGGIMVQETKVGAGGCGAALAMAALGLAVVVFIPILGWILGPLILLAAPFAGMNASKVWQCARCQAIIPRG